MDAVEIERKLLEWINAHPNSAYIKSWILSEDQRRIAWVHETHRFHLEIQNDVMDALFYVSGLAHPVYEETGLKGQYKHFRPSDFSSYGAAFASAIVQLKREVQS